MSLDVYLFGPNKQQRHGSGIFIRENGQQKEISRDEWDERNPGREPVVLRSEEVFAELFTANITHNMGAMAKAACIYTPLWHPEDLRITKAGQLIEPLRVGLSLLRSNPESFKQFNPKNGWGSYEVFVQFVADYLSACESNPDAEIMVSR